MSDYLTLVVSCSKAVRIYSTGNFEETLKIINSKLEKEHPVHLLIFCGNFETANNFLSRYQNGYIGISGQICDPSPALLNALRHDESKTASQLDCLSMNLFNNLASR